MLGIVEDGEIEAAHVSGKPSVKTDEDSLDKADSGIYDEHNAEKPSDTIDDQLDCDQSDDDDDHVVRRKSQKKSLLNLSADEDDSCGVVDDPQGNLTKDILVTRKLVSLFAITWLLTTTEEALTQVTNQESDEGLEKRDDTDSDEDGMSLSAVLLKKKKSRIKRGTFLGNDDDDSCDSAKGRDEEDESNAGKMTFDSTIFDAETDSDEDGNVRKHDDSDDESSMESDNRGYSESDREEQPISDKLKARLKKGAAKKPSTRKQKKAEMEERQEIHSETQRLIRESRVNIPYHQPKPKSLSDFLNSAAQKQSALKTLKGAAGFRSISWYEEKERERNKRREELKKQKALASKEDKNVEVKESEEVVGSSSSDPVEQKVVLEKAAERVSLLQEEDFDTLPDLVVEMDTNNEELRAEAALCVDLAVKELPDIISKPLTLQVENTVVSAECTLTGSSGNEARIQNSNADVSPNTSSIQLFEDPEEGAFAAAISPDECDINMLNNILKTERTNSAANPVTDNSELRTDIVGLTVESVYGNEKTSVTLNQKALSVADLKTLTPKLSGSPHMVISLDDGDGRQTPTNPGVVSLMSRFLQHSKKKKPQQSKDHSISIVQKEIGVDKKEELKLTTVVYHPEQPEDPLSQCDTPGAKLLALKEQLSAQMRVKREEARQKRVELYQLDNEEGYEEGNAEEEEEAEMTDGSDTEEEEDGDYKPGDQISSAEEEDEDIDEDVDEGDREVNPFADEEAEDEDDCDAADCEIGDEEDKAEAIDDEENESLKLTLSDEEDTMKEDKHNDDMDMDEDVIKPCQKVKKPRALTISDDEESKDGQEEKEDVEMTVEAGTENEKDVSFEEDCMTPFTKHISSATQPESWTCKIAPRPLSLPIEDSQDLYSTTESSQHSQLAPSDSQSLHFLSEDTQSQMLDADGFLKVNSTLKKPKHKPASLLGPSFEESTMDELLGLCSGRFGDPSQSAPPPGDKRTSRSLFWQPEMEDDNAHTGDMEELLGLCSGRFTDSSQIKSSQKRGIKRRPVADDADSDNESETSFTFVSDDEEKENRDNMAEPFSDEEEDGASNQHDEDSTLMPAPKFQCFTLGKKKGAGRIRREFVEDEAELSGSEYDSDEDLDIPEEEDILMEEEGDKDINISEEELRNQVGRVHMKKLMDEDHREMMRLQEMYLPDGDLYSEGKGRTRRFRWSNIDDTQEDMFGAGSDEEGVGEEDGEADSKWRMERHEREKWLQEQQDKDEADDSNSQFVKFGRIVLKQKNKPAVPEEESNADINKSDEVKKVKANLPKLALPSNSITSQKRGSFLSRGKDKLAKIAELTKSGVNTNAARTSKNFVFKPLSPEAEAKKLKANSKSKGSYSIPSGSQPPSAKRQKTMSISSFSQNSIFNHLH
ncbi:claspin-like [Liolophura sinensis]|uniref:claspin-like n=1 Tax=Liolophura sinensis TaxID=3198878 RepID=UPI003158AD98